MTDERCIDCGLHVFECECGCPGCGDVTCECMHDVHGEDCACVFIDSVRPCGLGETREQRDERRAGA